MSQNNETLKTTLPTGTDDYLLMSQHSGRTGHKKIIQANPFRAGKDELNLIEHPFAVLWQKEAADAVIFFEWDAKHPDTGRLLPASWMVAGHRDHGLPTATDERVYLVLLELTREAGFQSHTVNFSRYDILQRLGWDTSSKSYAMLQSAFDRLQGVSITAKNAFWNPTTRSFRNTAFNIIDLYDIESEPPGRKSARQRELPLSYFKWSDVMFDSFQSGYIRTLDLDFALSLNGDIALRLYRYLDKKAFNGRQGFEIELFNLCNSHLGMKPSPYPSKLKERLKPAHDELIERGFLREVQYQAMRSQKKAVKVCYTFARRALPEAPETGLSEGPLVLLKPTEKAARVDNNNDGLSAEHNNVMSRILAMKVSPDVARELVTTVPLEKLYFQLDCLTDREPRDRAATFVKAVRQGWEAPGKYAERQELADRAARACQTADRARARAASQKEEEDAKQAASDQENLALDAVWKKLDASTQEHIEAEAKNRLGVLGQTGRAKSALLAMRRNLMREMMLKINE